MKVFTVVPVKGRWRLELHCPNCGLPYRRINWFEPCPECGFSPGDRPDVWIRYSVQPLYNELRFFGSSIVRWRTGTEKRRRA